MRIFFRPQEWQTQILHSTSERRIIVDVPFTRVLANYLRITFITIVYMAKQIKCPCCKTEAVESEFRLVTLVSAPSDRFGKQEAISARICPKCNVVFYDREYDEKRRERKV